MSELKNIDEILENSCIPHETLVHIKLQIRALLKRTLIEYAKLCDSTLICYKSVEYVLKDLGEGLL